MSEKATSKSKPAPRVLVSVLNYNNYDKCVQTLRDLQEQDFQEFDLQVLDNTSDDGSFERLQETFPQIAMRSTGGNLGYIGGNNIALHQTLKDGYDYVFILNEDVLLPRDYLSQMLRCAQCHPHSGLVGSLIKHHESDAWQSCGGMIKDFRGIDHHDLEHEPDAEKKDRRVETVHGCAVLFTRLALEKGLFLNPDMHMYVDEMDLGFRAKKLGLEVWVCNDVVVRHNNNFQPGAMPATGHVYYITRNRIFLMLSHSRLLKKVLFIFSITLEAIAKNLLFRIQGHSVLAKYYNRGFRDGFFKRLGPLADGELGR